MTAYPVIIEYPAYKILDKGVDHKFRHGDKIMVPFKSMRGGELWHSFTLFALDGYAVENGDDVDEVRARHTAMHPNEPIYSAYANAVVLHSGPHTQAVVAGVRMFTNILFAGKRFQIQPANNQNIKLVEVNEDGSIK